MDHVLGRTQVTWPAHEQVRIYDSKDPPKQQQVTDHLLATWANLNNEMDPVEDWIAMSCSVKKKYLDFWWQLRNKKSDKPGSRCMIQYLSSVFFSATHRGHLWIMTLRVQVASFDLNQPNREHLLPGWVVECPGKSCPSLGISLKRGIRVEQCGGAMGKEGVWSKVCQHLAWLSMPKRRHKWEKTKKSTNINQSTITCYLGKIVLSPNEGITKCHTWLRR